MPNNSALDYHESSEQLRAINKHRNDDGSDDTHHSGGDCNYDVIA